MPNGNTHKLIAAVAVGGISFVYEPRDGEVTEKLLANALIAAMATNLPDLIEPASNPHHRQFFHSIACGSLVAGAGINLYQWQPEEEWEKILRQFLLVVCGGYLVHLVADSLTPRGLPLLGRV